ncbi:hypothetical protein [Albibacillus kandeliae]|uniref:hypothetical protein n=1 Tax=Albibacillus kandeliae TaxID=2174228 RepID=UPI000D693C8C|nr:hypothetical protein [Albibacillus kandeliae]
MSITFTPKSGIPTNLQDDGGIRDFLANHGAGVFDVLDAVRDDYALEALTCLTNGAFERTTAYDWAENLIAELLETFESMSCATIFIRSANFRGDDLLSAWNYYGARIADLASEHRQAMLAMQMSPDD